MTKIVASTRRSRSPLAALPSGGLKKAAPSATVSRQSSTNPKLIATSKIAKSKTAKSRLRRNKRNLENFKPNGAAPKSVAKKPTEATPTGLESFHWLPTKPIPPTLHEDPNEEWVNGDQETDRKLADAKNENVSDESLEEIDYVGPNKTYIIDYSRLYNRILTLSKLQAGSIFVKYGQQYPQYFQITQIPEDLRKKGLSQKQVHELDIPTLTTAGIKLCRDNFKLCEELGAGDVASVYRLYRMIRNDLFHYQVITNSWWGAGLYVARQMSAWASEYGEIVEFDKKGRMRQLKPRKVKIWIDEMKDEVKMLLVKGLGDKVVEHLNNNATEESAIEYLVRWWHKVCILFLLERFRQYPQNDAEYEKQKTKIMFQHGFSNMEEIWPTPFLAKLLIALWEPKKAAKITEYTHSTIDVLHVFNDIIAVANNSSWHDPIFILMSLFNLKVLGRMAQREDIVGKHVVDYEDFGISLWR
ncbi:hypothetical protein BC937DRAFT_88930 [Endogone sp. FLAS-F59071]|nr:hypothetical protein BC937DRAFT_88930 [Endogone sp. FLAS-F59071]|eukprot:RUS18315.1 hypothetical protein BC937DRAFT_88930 [Endogone sp. FLAS-F59071]